MLIIFQKREDLYVYFKTQEKLKMESFTSKAQFWDNKRFSKVDKA